ncbi:hypothetical protein [Sinomicrobium weinanense]|uniref:Uncharacterized protein n=1 Tax=Sinomicrobium weinanense TaxID=2842200 RepID=A0A926Q377_9FLAO|nr:hypothetical protein [Sinomicrobium weinanense]MBC9795716.1 hypothetical protein [Sinomicrobium weinanense]MBU3125279.1 hypothetical protein [Sinomicrobium weinanense]
MATFHSETNLSDCLKAIEEKLGWGSGSDWSSQNFEQLSEKILEHTGVTISHNTLKRLWGRIPYHSTPSTATLNTLAKFTGYENWSAFCAGNSKETHIGKKNHRPVRDIRRWGKNGKRTALTAILIISALSALVILSFSRTGINKKDFGFTSKKIAEGLPNSVIFEVEASGANANDKIEIQQSWDVSKRQIINKEDSLVASVYYNPGYFDAKLVVNDQIVKQHGILIPSDGWLALMETDHEPVYFKPGEFKSEKGMAVSPELIRSYHVNAPVINTVVNYYWVEDFKELRVDDFEMETSLKNIPFQNYRSCQKSEIILYCEGEIILIPLSVKGCIADLNLHLLDRNIHGNRNNLSGFGVEFSSWVSVKCVSKDGALTIFVNDRVAYKASLEGKTNRVYGVKYRFEGTGAISGLKISNSKKVFLDI